MDRASRFIWALDCGKKDRRLFQKAIKPLDKIARQTHDLSIFTDGERRYGNLLFEICHELVKNGKPGRPKKTFKRGVHVRVKNKGAQAHKKGRKRPKYQSPWKEHPETARTIEETDIHANHAEAFLRPCAENVLPFEERPICMPKQPRDCRGCYMFTGWCTIFFVSILPSEKFPRSLWAYSRGGCLCMKFSRFKWHK
jgi:hypothetical protein